MKARFSCLWRDRVDLWLAWETGQTFGARPHATMARSKVQHSSGGQGIDFCGLSAIAQFKWISIPSSLSKKYADLEMQTRRPAPCTYEMLSAARLTEAQGPGCCHQESRDLFRR